MSEYGFNEECNRMIDEVIESRRSVRSFKPEVPPEEDIKSIIRAGMLAPFAPLVVDPESDFRRFFVIKKGGKARKEIVTLMNNQVKRAYTAVKEMVEKNPQIEKTSQALIKLLKARSENGIPNLGEAPYFIIVAEEKGPMPVEQWSIAHCLENMWLKATALGLGFELISATEQLSNNGEFCKILGIQPGKFGLNGCLIGYPLKIPPATPRPDPEESTVWMD
ncbi:MAG: nitroreductase family protein [Candidatus Freyarchaeum deiterrae]